jgi:PAS domain S-box-containing protein
MGRDGDETAGVHRAAFEAAPEPVVVCEPSGALCDANPAAAEFFGRDRERLRECHVAELTGTDDPLGAAVAGGADTVTWGVGRDGDRREVAVSLRPAGERVVAYLDTGGAAGPTEGSTDDWRFQTGREHLETVVSRVPVVLFALDPEGTFTLSRGRGLEALGLGPEELVGQSVYEAYADYPELVAAVDRALAGETVEVTLELDGLAFDTWYRPVTDDGEVDQVIGVALDVTERVERERELAENDAILRQLTEATDDVFFLFDGAFEQLLFVNDAYEEVWGQSTAAVREDPMAFLRGVHPEDRDRVRRNVAHLQAGEPTEIEYRVNAREEFSRWVSVRGEPILADGAVQRVAGFARDVTERKERERELEQSNERLEQFAYVASHDLQEPLRTVSNYVGILAEDYADDLDEEAQEFVDVAVTASERMESMIEGLLDYSRVTTRGEAFETVDAGSVLEDAVADIEVMLTERDGEVNWGTLPTVRADRDQLRQLFQNLLTNALEHGGEGVSVTVDAEERTDDYRFTVADDGPGIPENQREKVFRIFKSGENYQTSSQAKGIGLAVCDNIVQRHDGDIRVADETEGTTVVFTIAKR